VRRGLPVTCCHSAGQPEGAAAQFTAAGFDTAPFSVTRLLATRPTVVLLANDWGAEGRLICVLGRWFGWRTVCVQESVIDFEPGVGRMRRADILCFQGDVSARAAGVGGAVITGNPRYEELEIALRDASAPVMVNCNFTYGIQEDLRHTWMTDVTDALRKARRDFFISQHPRDRADLGAYGPVQPSSALVVHDQLRSASALITRFSSVIHEALMLGRPVLYYRARPEDVHYDFGASSAAYRLATTGEELLAALTGMLDTPLPPEVFWQQLEGHLLLGGSKPSNAIADIVVRAGELPLNRPSRATIRDLGTYVKWSWRQRKAA
jgi:hypothetical protein